MNRILLKIVSLSIFISCSDADNLEEINYTGFIEKDIVLSGYDENFELTDSLCLVSLKIPSRLDTFYNWCHVSCNTSSSWLKYRFADKTYPQFAESGWFWTVVPDSTYQLSICHKPVRMTPDSIFLKPLSEKDKNDRFYLGGALTSNDSAEFIFKDFRYINEKAFIISAYLSSYSYLTQSPALFVVASTNLKDRELFFVGECSAKDTIGFVESMYKSFLSIRIKENP